MFKASSSCENQSVSCYSSLLVVNKLDVIHQFLVVDKLVTPTVLGLEQHTC